MSEKTNQPDQEDNIGNVDEQVDLEYVDQDLPVALTEQERLAIGEAIAQAQNEAEVWEVKKKGLVQEYNGTIKKFHAEVSELSRTLRNGMTKKPVQVRVKKDYGLGWITMMRMDDHTELISRPMTPDERQMGIAFG